MARRSTTSCKLDLLVTADFRMTSTTLFSDLIFPAATWYEKYYLSSTDMIVHPLLQPGNSAAVADQDGL